MTVTSFTRHAAARRDWSNTHHYEISYASAENPPRQGCRWNPKEDFDLLNAYTSGVPTEKLARTHQRTLNAIAMRLFTERVLIGTEKYLSTTPTQ